MWVLLYTYTSYTLHHNGKGPPSHVEADSHKQLDVFVADAGEDCHLLQEASNVLYLLYQTYVYVDTPMPVATVPMCVCVGVQVCVCALEYEMIV